jgi:hypothetical protein
MSRQRAAAATRVLSADFAKFEGCMFGSVSVPDPALTQSAIAYARGSGDPLWPHTCSRALTRIATDAAAIAADDSQYQSLAHAANAMESALGEAVFWTGHIRARRARAASWLHEFVELRREVKTWLGAHGAALASPVLPAQPRVPRRADEPDPPPPPEALFGGAEADIVDAITTPTHFAWILRDRRSQYARCSVRWSEGHQPDRIECVRLHIGNGGDPRDLAWVASLAEPHLVGSSRPPLDERPVLDFLTLRTELTVRGMTQAPRDFFAQSAAVVWGIQRDRFALTIRSNGPVSERTLSGRADVLATDRAFGSDGERVYFSWITPGRRSAMFHAIVAATGEQTQLPLTGNWSSYDRAIYPCTEGLHGQTQWLVSDGTSRTIAIAPSGGHLQPLFQSTTPLSRHAWVTCSTHRALWVATADQDHSPVELCDDRWTERKCRLLEHTLVDRSSALAVTDQVALMAMPATDGSPFAVRAMVLEPTLTSRLISAPPAEPAIPTAHALRILASGTRILVLTRAAQTHAFRLDLQHNQLTPMLVAQAATGP